MDGIITGILDQIQARVLAAIQMFVPTFSPLWLWYFWYAVLVVALIIIAVFVQFKWPRFFLGLIGLFGLAFVLGGRQMRKEDQAELDRARAKLKPAPKPKSTQPAPGENVWPTWLK